MRTRDRDSLALFLGRVSVGLGTAQLAAPLHAYDGGLVDSSRWTP